MGKHLNPESTALYEAYQDLLYVDKSEMLSFLNRKVNTAENCICVTRPRRFGKTYAADMVSAYYGRNTDARPLFERLKISSTRPHVLPLGDVVAWDTYLGAFDVVRVTMTEFLRGRRSIEAAIALLQHDVMEELSEAYPDVSRLDEGDLVSAMKRVRKAKGTQFVVVIDEWDAPLRVRADDTEGQELYLDFLRDWLKDQDWLALAYTTGILPIKKYGDHSALNMFWEYSMLSPSELAPYAGFTEDEVRGLCRRFGQDFEPLREWYDGYEVRGTAPIEDTAPKEERPRYSLYSPLSVVKAITSRKVRNYWNATVAFVALADQINRDFDGLKEKVSVLVRGGRVIINTKTYQNDLTTLRSADDVLTMLVHLGYLGFDEDTSEVYVPNREVLQEFESSTDTDEWAGVFRELEESKEILYATWDLDTERVAELLDAAHDNADNKTYNSEEALKFAVLYAYYAAQVYYTVIPELGSGKGYADIAYIPAPAHPEVPAMVVELKWDKDARTAIDQIRDRDYPARLSHYEGNIILVGVNYDRDARAGSAVYKRHSCIVERA